ncbi:hypothetical protein [Mucilaginibacter paludis]|uniref:DUF3592 domain-containing protein n=1 Tax=Mucilaginibacter paludis DSM 18603 TaxID=714943 RepID=H1Y722_9SPHI|nr:hypothetical protein [Mucilaginibacter paludis]EHQ28641.1 hypothetical protein Mucpa_4551 [Mucilaginibacter paludis DSM 18603]
MHSIWSDIRFYAGIILWLLITFAVFLVGWGMSFTSIDLSTAPKTTGVISSAVVKLTDAGKAGGINSFVFQVNDLPDGYWLYRANGDYSSLYNSLKTGTKVTIYHSKTIQSNGLYTVYQLQDGDHVDYSKDEYEGKEKWAGRLIALPGAVLLLVMIFVQIKKRRRQESSANNVE